MGWAGFSVISHHEAVGQPVAKPAEGAVSRSGEAEKPLLALWRCLAVWVGVSEHKRMTGSMGSWWLHLLGRSGLELLPLWPSSSRFQKKSRKIQSLWLTY